MDTHDLFHRNRKHTERVGIAQVVLRGVGYVFDIRKALDLIGGYACLFKSFGIEFRIAFSACIDRYFAFCIVAVDIQIACAIYFAIEESLWFIRKIHDQHCIYVSINIILHVQEIVVCDDTL